MDIFDLLNLEGERVDVSNIKPTDLIRGDEVYIPKHLWLSLKEHYSQDDLIDLLNRAVDENNLPFPYVEITEEQARKSFEDLQGAAQGAQPTRVLGVHVCA